MPAQFRPQLIAFTSLNAARIYFCDRQDRLRPSSFCNTTSDGIPIVALAIDIAVQTGIGQRTVIIGISCAEMV